VIPGPFLCVCQIKSGDIGFEWGSAPAVVLLCSYAWTSSLSFLFLDWAYWSGGGVDPRELNSLTEFTQTTPKEVIQNPSNSPGKSRSSALQGILQTRE